MTPFVIASRTSATDLPEKSSRSAAAAAGLVAAEAAFCPVPAALPARLRAGVDFVCALLRPPDAELERRDVLLPDLRVLEERDDADRDVPEPDLRVLEERDAPEPDLRALDLEPDERDPPDEPEEREELDRDDDDFDPPDRPPPREDPPLLPPDDSAITASSAPAHLP
jgi:hypothetical protein